MTSRASSYSNPSIPSLILQDSELLYFPGTQSQLFEKCKFPDPAMNRASVFLSTLKLPVFLQTKGQGIDGCNLSKLETRKVNSAGS